MTIEIHREPIVEQCRVGNTGKPCERIIEGDVCKTYGYPHAKWRAGRNCPMATNITHESKSGPKTRVGQQKQKKKGKK